MFCSQSSSFRSVIDPCQSNLSTFFSDILRELTHVNSEVLWAILQITQISLQEHLRLTAHIVSELWFIHQSKRWQVLALFQTNNSLELHPFRTLSSLSFLLLHRSCAKYGFRDNETAKASNSKRQMSKFANETWTISKQQIKQDTVYFKRGSLFNRRFPSAQLSRTTCGFYLMRVFYWKWLSLKKVAFILLKFCKWSSIYWVFFIKAHTANTSLL